VQWSDRLARACRVYVFAPTDGEGIVFSGGTFVHPFVRSDIVTTISHERLEVVLIKLTWRTFTIATDDLID